MNPIYMNPNKYLFHFKLARKKKKIATTTKTVIKLKTKETKNIRLILHGYSWLCQCFFVVKQSR